MSACRSPFERAQFIYWVSFYLNPTLSIIVSIGQTVKKKVLKISTLFMRVLILFSASFTRAMVRKEWQMQEKMIDIGQLTESQQELILRMIAEFERMNQRKN